MQTPDPKRVLAHKIAAVARTWRRLADDALAQFGVSNSAGWCLIHIQRDGPSRQAELAFALGIAQPTLVRTLDQLQGGGLIHRVQHPHDKRSNLIGLTPAGEELVGRIEARLDGLRGDLLKDVPDDVVEVTLWLLDVLATRIADYKSRP